MALPLMGNNGQLERAHAPPAPQLAGIGSSAPPLAGIGQLALGYALPAPLPQVDNHTLLARLKALEDSAIATAAAGASRATPMMLTLDPSSIAVIRADKSNGIDHIALTRATASATTSTPIRTTNFAACSSPAACPTRATSSAAR